MPATQKAEVSSDTLGYLLVWSEDGPCGREGEPIGAPDYYRTESDAKNALRRLRKIGRPTSRIQQRQLDASRRELHSMTSEIKHYGEEFTGPQLLAMRATMRALKKLIRSLEAAE